MITGTDALEPDEPQELEAAQPGQHQVEHDHARRARLDRAQRSVTVGGGFDLEPLVGQVPREHVAHDRLVVDDQHARR